MTAGAVVVLACVEGVVLGVGLEFGDVGVGAATWGWVVGPVGELVDGPSATVVVMVVAADEAAAASRASRAWSAIGPATAPVTAVDAPSATTVRKLIKLARISNSRPNGRLRGSTDMAPIFVRRSGVVCGQIYTRQRDQKIDTISDWGHGSDR